jgi:outer membrane protein assembly factor BamA
MKKIIYPAFFCSLLAFSQFIQAQKIKKGWSVGAVPAIAFDSDIGLKLGAVVNFFDYGDGKIYPKYRHSLFFEYSLTTKGSGIAQFIYDSKFLIPGIRLTTEASYLTERALDFYGFNGYEALYDKKFEDDSPDNPDYRSRQYYREERKLLRLRTDFQGRFYNDKIRWLTGISYYDIKTDSIDVNRLNKGKSDDEKLPIDGGLYGDYARWGIIPSNQFSGGQTTLLKGGLVYDTRDNEPNPMHGMWSEIIFLWAPDFLASGDFGYSKICLTHRQYFTLVPDRLSFVYRIAYQAKLWGKMPYYMLPFIYNGGNSLDRDGLGGAKTVRGILRDRIVGEDYLYGTLEFRWKFIRTVFLKQNIYTALNVFSDFGMVTGKYKFDKTNVPAKSQYMFPDEKEKLHMSYGAGLHLALNQNFVVAINYGIAADKKDGSKGLYIGLNWLF